MRWRNPARLLLPPPPLTPFPYHRSTTIKLTKQEGIEEPNGLTKTVSYALSFLNIVDLCVPPPLILFYIYIPSPPIHPPPIPLKTTPPKHKNQLRHRPLLRPLPRRRSSRQPRLPPPPPPAPRRARLQARAVLGGARHSPRDVRRLRPRPPHHVLLHARRHPALRGPDLLLRGRRV